MNKPVNPAKHNRLLQQIQEIYALYQQGQHTKAQSQITRLLAKNPKSSHAHTLAAMIASATNQSERALYHATTATKLDPKNTDALTTLASLHALNNKHDQALPLYQQALAIHPDHPGALAGLGTAQSQLGQYQAARKTLQQVQALSPDLPEPIINRALLELDTTHARRAIEILQSAPQELLNHPGILSLNALAHSYDDTKTPQQVMDAHQRYGQQLQQHIPPTASYKNTKDPNRTLNIGYLSSDLHAHSITYFLEPILTHHNKSNFQTHIFSTSPHRDQVTERLNATTNHWHQCDTQTLPELIEYIKSQEIDILVELTGHFTGHKLPVFAAKPAPIQITFIGYGNTTGLDRINTRFVDTITDPSTKETPNADQLATETLTRLDGCFLCYQPPNPLPHINTPNPTGPFTLGSFNNLNKLSGSTITLWSKILLERPNTQLLLKSAKLANQKHKSELKSELIERFKAQGINESRLDLRAFSPTLQSHLETYNELDLALDTFPYTGTTTTCEALAMGVPVLTLLGDTHAGRVSTSLLTAAGFEDFIAHSPEDYITKALAFIDNAQRSQSSRQQLRDQTLNSPLCDQASYTTKVERAYRTLWTQWCAT